MIIRSDQMRALVASGQKEFMQRLAHHLRTSFPEETQAYDDPQLHEQLVYILDLAYHLGFSLEPEIASLAEYILIFQLDIHGSYAQSIFHNPDLHNSEKLERLGNVILR